MRNKKARCYQQRTQTKLSYFYSITLDEFLYQGSEKMQKNYYAIIPANVRYDKELPANAKLLYGEITALCNEKGYCWASNNYFSELYQIHNKSISRLISQLDKKGYIKIEMLLEGKQVKSRHIYITPSNNDVTTLPQKSVEGGNKNVTTPSSKIVAENNTSFNTTSNNTKEVYIQYAEFVKMKESEYNKLVEEHGEPLTKKMIQVLDNYKGANGKKYKSDYRAILNWVVDKVKGEKNERTKQSGRKSLSEYDWLSL
jgi:hypothetical protein